MKLTNAATEKANFKDFVLLFSYNKISPKPGKISLKRFKGETQSSVESYEYVKAFVFRIRVNFSFLRWN